MPSRLHIDRAARIVLAGGVIAYPTEAVFGLGCLAQDRAAVSTAYDSLRARPVQEPGVGAKARAG